MNKLDLPPLALSVRQPWAWAIIHGGKVIENRSAGSIRAGKMDCRRICIHAATAMREKEYRWSIWKMAQIGVTVPRPDQLQLGAIIGTVDVVDIITESDSPWFGGPCGLVLDNPQPVPPIPAKGELGYFRWEEAPAFAEHKPWMTNWNRPNGDDVTLDLFDEPLISFREDPDKPFKGYRRDKPPPSD